MKKFSLLILLSLTFIINIKAQSAHSLDSIPEKWVTSIDSIQIDQVEEVVNWWKIFNDSVLNHLIEEAVYNNLNVKVALQRIEQGRLMYQQSKAGYYPSFALDAATNISSFDMPNDTEDYTMFYNAGIQMNWELDVFGRIKRGTKVAKYSYQQVQEDKNSVMVSILSEVSSTYIRLRMYQNQILVAKENITLQENALSLARDRFQSGVNSKLDVLQSQSILYATRASLNTLKAQSIAEINIIQVLIGQYPQQLETALLREEMLPEIPQHLQTMLPVDVVRQRPDIRSAEKGLMAMMANEKLKGAEMLPSLAITGQVGFASTDASNWFTSDSFNYMVGPTLRWDIFQGMYKSRDKQIAKVQVQEAQLSYQNTVLTAMNEVETSLSNIKELKDASFWVTENVSTSNEAFSLSMEQYQEGIIDYQPVLNSQQTLLSSQNQEVEVKANLLGQIISLYQSLGGNWVEEDADNN